MSDTVRCTWCGSDPLYVDYHDRVWGVPEYDSKALFAKLVLDGAQAGLSWITILRRQHEYYRVFEGLDPERMAGFSGEKAELILQDPGIIRNRAKVRSAIGNARAWIAMRERGIDFSDFLWRYTDGKPLANTWESGKDIPAATPLAEQISKALKQEGFSFVGPTIVYAFMQAVGMVNDHVVSCFRHGELSRP